VSLIDSAAACLDRCFIGLDARLDILGVLGREVDRDADLARCRSDSSASVAMRCSSLPLSSRKRAMISQTSGPAASAARRS
jgi:hypothetical protein